VPDFRINIVVDPARATAGSRRVRGELDRTTRSANTLQRTLGRAFAVVVSGAALRSVTNTLAGFSQEMSTVGAVSQATADQMQQLQEQAISLGTNTRFSATQAAEGMTFLARAGFEAEQVLGSIDDTLRLAQAGALDLGRAADIASNVLTGFRLNVNEAARVVDVLALAANSSNTTVGQLGEAMKVVAPIAAGVGVSIEEATAAISALSNAGLQASTAGTGLRRILGELESPSAATEKILRELGVTTDEVRISQVGLTQALSVLANAGVDTGQALELFGQRGGPAFEVLRTSIPDIQKFTTELGSAEGTAERIATTMDDNLNGAVLGLKSAFEGLILRLGQSGATGALRTLLETITNGLRSAADNIDQFINGVQGLVFVLGVRLARQAIPAAIAGLRGLAIAIATNPFGALLTGVTLVSGALITFRDQLTLTSDSTTTFASVATAGFEELKSVFDSFVPLLQGIGETINTSLGGAFTGFELNLQNGLLLISSFADTTIGIFLALGNSLTSLFAGIGPAIGSAFFTIINGVLGLIESAVDRTRAFFGSIGSTATSVGISLTNFFRELNVAATQLAQGLPGAAAETAGQAAELLQAQLGGIGETFSNTFKGQLESLRAEDLVGQLNNPFEGAGGDLAASMTKGFNEGLNFTGTTDFILRAIDTANAQTQQAEAAERVAAAQKTVNEEVEKGTVTMQPFVEEVGAATMAAEGLGRTLSDGLRDGLEAGLRGITDVAGAAESALVNGFGAAEDAIVEFATTGKVNFSAFVDGLLADVARILARQAITGLLSAFGGGGGAGFLGSLFGGGRAEGGPVNPNQAFVVGEEGPEVFVPPGAGNIMTAAETAAAGAGGGGGTTTVQAPPVNVSVVNVTDPSEITAAMNSPEGEQMILNIIAKNRSSVKNSLA